MVDLKHKHVPFCAKVLCTVAGSFLLASSALIGDVIYLKNGKKLQVDRAWEEGNKVRYEKNGNLFGFSKELVERLGREEEPPTADGATAPSESSASSRLLPIEVLNGHLELDNVDPSISVVRDGKIDLNAIQSMEKASRQNPLDLAARQAYQTALSQAIELLVQQGDLASSMTYLQRLLLLDPNNLQAQMATGAIHLRNGQYALAEDVLSQALVQHPDSADLLYLLGSACYFQEKNQLAKQHWERSLQLKFRPELEGLLKKIEGENRAEDLYRQSNSLHFMIKYEGNENNQALGKAILSSLEKSFFELEPTLGFSPKQPIAVVLYPDEVFRDITQTPSWVGALNDGKIRLPIKGLTQLDDDLKRILKHELIHSFVRLKSGPDCPVWLNEGLAQYLAGESTHSYLYLFKQAVSEKKLPPLQHLEAPFLALPLPVAQWAYKESLLAVEFLDRSFGMREIQRLLEQMSSTAAFESVLKKVLQRDYPGLQSDLEEYVRRQ
jgi:tetratricopeptide (TPR) repeat protein